ncbi:MAG: DeoR/GlpR family DNA-binding transcription regulator [Propionibacteriaceae bacterium]|jgi:DeoR/GlpR family transcriptional regulator of sugar metabolism|nr:DeoR/GlpR family DNA-binding transcription regulator [Propionibacteriaceae bacterium]
MKGTPVHERRTQILGLLQSEESIRIADLSRVLGVSRETVRKDLYDLAAEGLLTTVRGGAVLTASNAETAYDLRLGTRREEKRRIARAAVGLVSPGDTVFLDYGTTTFALAAQLLRYKDLTVVTNALPIAQLLAGTPSIQVMLPGGLVRGTENSLYGPLTARNLRHLHFDAGFFGCVGVDPAVGFTNPNLFESETSALAMARCGAVVMVVDHSKFGVVAAHVTAPADRPDLIVTDDQAPESMLHDFESHQVAVRVAAEAEPGRPDQEA